MLASGSGTMEYLYLKPDSADKNSSGTFEWTTTLQCWRECGTVCSWYRPRELIAIKIFFTLFARWTVSSISLI